MGSTGTGRFTDYPGTPRGSAKSKDQGGTGGGEANETNQCERKLENVTLEEVARCAFYKPAEDLPSVGTSVVVCTSLVGGRIGVQTAEGGQVVGLLPTEYNYLLQCMKQGYQYAGAVVSAKLRPVPVVRVDLGPRR
jgi:hypothetical protein